MSSYNKNASHSFAFLPQTKIKRNVFDRSHEYKTTMDAGYLVPLLVDEVLPGDTITLNNLSIFSRINTLTVPIMDNLYMECFAWSVPSRLVWDHWKNFNGETVNPGDSTDFLVPQVVAPSGGFTVGSVADYFGLPVNVPNLSVSALPFRALNLIYNEWYRDENLQNSLIVQKGDGPDNYSLYPLFRRGKRHDYFTSSLPWPQKGDSVSLALSGNASVTVSNLNIYGNGMAMGLDTNNASYGLVTGNSGANQGLMAWVGARGTGSGTGISNNAQPVNNVSMGLSVDPRYSGITGYGNGIADLSSVSAVGINNLRNAIQVQAFRELDARGGTRYTEIIRAHFGVISPDARLQRPELLAVSSSMMQVNTVPQTSSTDATTPQANLSAYGVFAQSQLHFSKSFTEHGYIFILANIRADLTYQQGIDRMWSRKTRLDYFWPLLSGIGEQAVYNKEIYAQGTEDDNGIFGYQERYAEYRYFPSKITGKLRSGVDGSLDVWHLSQYFTSLPKLNSQFIEDNPPIDRVIAVQDEPQFTVDCHFQGYKCVRPIPLFGIPSSLGVHL